MSSPRLQGRVEGAPVTAKDFWKEHLPLSLRKLFPFHFTTCHRLDGDGREPGSTFRATSTMGVEIRVEITDKKGEPDLCFTRLRTLIARNHAQTLP